MKNKILLDEYKKLTTPQRFHFFFCTIHERLAGFEEREIHNFLRAIIFETEENLNIRKKAVELHTDYILLNKLKPRYALTILLDDWVDQPDVFLEVRRLKDLFLFYEEEPDEILKIYKLGTSSCEIEVQSESYFYLGLIYFLSALKSAKDSLYNLFQDSLQAFETSFEIIENRIDAEFFKAVVIFIIDLMDERKDSSAYHLSKLTEILWRRDALSISQLNSPFQISFYRALFSISQTDRLLQSTWLDYRDNFSKLYYYFCEIKNDELKCRLSESLLKEEFSKYCLSSFFDPYILVSPAYELAKVDEYLKEVSIDSSKYEFLNYLKEIGIDINLKKS